MSENDILSPVPEAAELMQKFLRRYDTLYKGGKISEAVYRRAGIYLRLAAESMERLRAKNSVDGKCPCCGTSIAGHENEFAYCPYCGQAIADGIEVN